MSCDCHVILFQELCTSCSQCVRILDFCSPGVRYNVVLRKTPSNLYVYNALYCSSNLYVQCSVFF